MIKTALIAASAFALTTGVAFAQGAAQSAPQSAPTAAPSPPTQGDATVTASAPMPQSAMPATPTMVANTPAGDAPSKYPKCTHKGQDRCISMARR